MPPFDIDNINIRDFPKVGKWHARIGRVFDIWGTPCNTDLDMWVLAAWQTVPYALLMLIKPSQNEYALSRFGRRHGRRVQINVTSNVQAQGMGLPIKGEAQWMLFRIGSAVQVANQYMQFADIATTGLLQWSSLVYNYSGCEIPGGGGGSQTSIAPTVMLGSLSGSPLTLATNVTQAVRCVGFANTWACDPTQQWSGSWSVSWSPIPGAPAPNPTFELIDGYDLPRDTWNGAVPETNGVGIGYGFYRYKPPDVSPKNFMIRYRSDYSFLVNRATFSVAGGPQQNFLKYDP